MACRTLRVAAITVKMQRRGELKPRFLKCRTFKFLTPKPAAILSEAPLGARFRAKTASGMCNDAVANFGSCASATPAPVRVCSAPSAPFTVDVTNASGAIAADKVNRMLQPSVQAMVFRFATFQSALGAWLFAGVYGIVGCAPGALQTSLPPPTRSEAFGLGLKVVKATPQVRIWERNMVRLVNEDRASQALPPLVFDNDLANVARFHSHDMVRRRFFAHVSPDGNTPSHRLDRAGYLFLSTRENLSEALDIESSERGLLDSPHHYDNIMATDVTHIGIGIVRGGVHDSRSITVTQLFATPAKLESPENASKKILHSLGTIRRKLELPPPRLEESLTALAVEGLSRLPPTASPERLKRLSMWLQDELNGLEYQSVQISTQLMLDSSQAAAPTLIHRSVHCHIGLATRRTEDENGRPALQLLLLVGDQAGR